MLLLCTANQCRSPMAEVLLRRRLEAVTPPVAVSSAGSYPGGSPATGDAQRVMAARGLDLSAHVSRRVDRQMIDAADLLVGMTREHVREVVSINPDSLPRVFTLKELVRAGARIGARPADESVAAWLKRVGEGRRQTDLVGVGHDESLDVEDPIGRGLSHYEATAEELEGLLGELADLTWPSNTEHGRERSA